MVRESEVRVAEARHAAAEPHIPSGFKQTEVGVIPEDWDVMPLSEVCTLHNGRAYALQEWEKLGTPVIRLQNLTGGDEYYYSRLKLPAEQFCQMGDLLYMWSATFGPRIWNGERAIYHYHIWKVSPHLGTAQRRYLFYKLGEITQEKKTRAANGGTMLHVTKRDMEATLIALPKMVEQETIARVLSDADALIESLGQLSAKKRQIKQGAMQELITGKKRLPGFEKESAYKQAEIGVIPADWVTVHLPEVVWYQEGPGVRNYQFTSAGVKLFNGTNIENGRVCLEKTSRYISEREACGQYSHFLADAGDIVIACSGITVSTFDDKVSVLSSEHLPLCMNTSTMRFKVASPRLDKDYFKYFLRSQLFKDQISGKATGSAQLNFGPAHVRAVFVPLPTNAEQVAIASILSDMDADIAALNEKLTKAHLIKQGMMQELLTGKTRLI